MNKSRIPASYFCKILTSSHSNVNLFALCEKWKTLGRKWKKISHLGKLFSLDAGRESVHEISLQPKIFEKESENHFLSLISCYGMIYAKKHL